MTISDITEFIEVDPTEFHLVGEGASGFPVLMAKAREEVTAVLDETGDLTKARWAGFCAEESCEVCKGRFGVAFSELLRKAKLKTKARNTLPTSAFALPETREYPIHDKTHGQAALRMLHNASPADQTKIKAAVHRRYPDIDSDDAKKEMPSQESEQGDKTIPSPSSVQGQSHEIHSGREMGPVHMTVTQEGVTIHNPSFEGSPAPTNDQEGHGTTAPNKTLPMAEAKSQSNTRKALQKKLKKNLMQLAAAAQALSSMGGEGDGRGDPAPEGEKDLNEAKREGATQTEEMTRKAAPGSPGWESHDADLAGSAAELAERAQQLMEELESREKEEKTQPTSTSKEIDMTTDELLKMLDERDARRAAEDDAAKATAKKAAKQKAAKAKKKMKMKMKEDAEMPEMAEKALGDPAWVAANPKLAAKAATWAAKAGVARMTGAATVQKSVDDLSKQIADVKELAEKIASQPMPVPLLNSAGLDARGGAALHRGMAPATLIKERGATESWSPNSVRAELAAKGALGDIVPGSAQDILQKFAAAGSPEGKFSI